LWQPIFTYIIMKNLLVLFTLVLFFASCENVEDNSPAFQAKVDNVFFESDLISASRFPGQKVEMIGVKDDEKITLSFTYTAENLIPLGGGSGNFATFEDKFGNIYSTNEDAIGEILLTFRTGGNQVLSGNFNFTAVLKGIDTLRINNGVFYKVRNLD